MNSFVLRPPSKASQSLDGCGTHFIIAKRFAWGLSVVHSYSALSSTRASSAAAELRGGIGTFSVSAGVKQAEAESRAREALRLDWVRTGGWDTSALVLPTDPDDLSGTVNALEAARKTLAEATPEAVAYGLLPLGDLKSAPISFKTVMKTTYQTRVIEAVDAYLSSDAELRVLGRIRCAQGEVLSSRASEYQAQLITIRDEAQRIGTSCQEVVDCASGINAQCRDNPTLQGEACVNATVRPFEQPDFDYCVASCGGDADQVTGVDDKCPCENEDQDGIEDSDGCPEPDAWVRAYIYNRPGADDGTLSPIRFRVYTTSGVVGAEIETTPDATVRGLQPSMTETRVVGSPFLAGMQQVVVTMNGKTDDWCPEKVEVIAEGNPQHSCAAKFDACLGDNEGSKSSFVFKCPGGW